VGLEEADVEEEGLVAAGVAEESLGGTGNGGVAVLADAVALGEDVEALADVPARDVPLADIDGAVAVGAEPLAQVGDVAQEGPAVVHDDAVLGGGATRVPAGARGAADGVGGVGAAEVHALGDEAVEVGGAEELVAVGGEGAAVLLVGVDEDDVRPLAGPEARGEGLGGGAARARGAEGLAEEVAARDALTALHWSFTSGTWSPGSSSTARRDPMANHMRCSSSTQ